MKAWRPNRYPYCGCKFEQIKKPDGTMINGNRGSRSVKSMPEVYFRIDNIEELKKALAEQRPVTIGMVRRIFRRPLAKCFLLVGYDDSLRAFIAYDGTRISYDDISFAFKDKKAEAWTKYEET